MNKYKYIDTADLSWVQSAFTEDPKKIFATGNSTLREEVINDLPSPDVTLRPVFVTIPIKNYQK